jgi:predicted ATPase
LAFLDEALAVPSLGYGRVLLVESYRLKGELLLMLSQDKLSEAELWFLRALEIAQEQGAIMLELRAAISLTHLWEGTGKFEQGKKLLSEAYAKFSEGYTTVDLMEAQSLLQNYD